MIVRETTKAISDTTNPRDVAGAKAVKEMLNNAGENVTLKPTTKVNVSGTLKNLNTYINNIAETTSNVVFNEKFGVEDISSDLIVTSTLNTVSLVYAYKVHNILFIKFHALAGSDYTVGGAEVWARGTISGLSLKTNDVTVMANFSESDLASNATLTSNNISFYTLPFNSSDEGASGDATFMVLLND